MDTALVLFSGGQDSTTCLLYALTRYTKVWTIGFDYGQRHICEITCRREILQTLSDLPAYRAALAEDVVVPIPGLDLLDNNALTGTQAICEQPGRLPTTFVPARNLLFLSYAAAYAYGRDIATLVCGVGEADFSGYPDCRQATMASAEETLSLGLDRPIRIETPLMQKTKAETWQFAWEIGGDEAVELIRTKTHTCYANDHTTWHAYGYGCGICPSCRLRKKGWEEFCQTREICVAMKEPEFSCVAKEP